jgi:site-specific DNA recombinase
VFNRSSAKDSLGKRNTHLYKDDEDIIFVDGGCPQIVDRQVYEKVQGILTEHKHTGGRENAKESYLLSGKVFCRECGRAMVGNARYSGRSKLLYVTYRCPSRKHICNNKEINRDYLEQYVTELIEQEILNANTLKKLQKKIERHAETAQKPKESQLERERREIDTAIRNVADAIERGLISDALVSRLKELEKRKAELERSQSLTLVSTTDAKIDPSFILSEYADVKCTPASPQYKDFIRGFIDRIEVGSYTVRITLKIGLDIFPELNRSYEVRRQEIYTHKKMV